MYKINRLFRRSTTSPARAKQQVLERLMASAVEKLEERTLLSTTPIFVNNNWAYEIGQSFDPDGTGTVFGSLTFGVDAFDTIQDGIDNFDPEVNSAVNVIAGDAAGLGGGSGENYAGNYSIYHDLTLRGVYNDGDSLETVGGTGIQTTRLTLTGGAQLGAGSGGVFSNDVRITRSGSTAGKGTRFGDAVSLANSGATLRITGPTGSQGQYINEAGDVAVIDRNLTLIAANATTIESVRLTNGAQIASLTGPLSTPTVNIDRVGSSPGPGGTRLSDAQLLLSTGGQINAAAGTWVENLVVTKRLTLDGAGAGSTFLQAATVSQPALSLSATATGTGAGQRLIISDLAVSGSMGADNVVVNDISHLTLSGLAITGAGDDNLQINYPTGNVSDIDLIDLQISGATNNGIVLNDSANTLTDLLLQGGTIQYNRGNGFITGYTESTGVSGITIDGTAFTGNGWQNGQNFGNVMFHLFNGNATITDVTIDGTSNQAGVNDLSTYGINFTGATPWAPAGTVVMTDVEVNGRFRKSGLQIQRYSQIDGFNATPMSVDLIDATVRDFTSTVVVDHSDADPLNLGTSQLNKVNLWQNGATPGGADATSATFYVYGTTTALDKDILADNFTIANQVADAVDVTPWVASNTLRWKAGEVFITPNSFFAPMPGASVQNAVKVALPGDTIYVQGGTYSGDVTIDKDVTLRTAGDVNLGGSLNASNGTISPGVAAGSPYNPALDDQIDTITATTVSLTSTAELVIQVASSADYDKIVGSGSVTLDGATLTVVDEGYLPDLDNPTLTLISGSPVAGTFDGLAEDATVEIGDFPFAISYLAGVTLTLQDPNVVYVDDDWSANSVGDIVGDNYVFGYNAWATIQDGVDAVAISGAVNVADGTYDEAVLVNKTLTLSGAGDDDTVPTSLSTITRSAGSNQFLVTVAASNVTIDGFELVVNRTYASAGIYATNAGGFDDLTISNNTIRSEGTGGTIPGAPITTSAAGIFLDGTGSPYYEWATITGNTIEAGADPDGSGPLTASLFARGIWLREMGADITDNTILASTQDLLFQFATGGDIDIDGNTFYGAGADFTEPHQSGPANIDITNNQFLPVSPAFSQSLLIKHSAGVPIVISGNTFTGHTTGLYIGGSDGVTATGNTFTPAAGLSAFRNIYVNTGWPGTIGGTFVPVSATIQGNILNGNTGSTGTGLEFATTIAGAGYGSIVVGGAGSLANTFSDTAAGSKFIRLSNLTNPTTLDIDASQNLFALPGGTSRSADLNPTVSADLADLFALEDRIVHEVDLATLGFVTTKAGHVFVTPNSFETPNSSPSIQRGIDAADTGDTVRVQAGTYTGSPTINKSLDLIGDGADSTIMQLVLPAAAGKLYGALTIEGNDTEALVQGFTIAGARQDGGQATSNVHIKVGVDEIVFDQIKFLVALEGTNGDSGIGIRTDNSSANAIEKIAVTGSEFVPLDTGIGARRAFYLNPGVLDFDFTGNTIAGWFKGRSITQADNSLVSSNVVDGQGLGGFGLGTWYPQGPGPYETVFEYNTFTGLAEGIGVFDTDNVTIQNNLFDSVATGILFGDFGTAQGETDPATILVTENSFSDGTLAISVTDDFVGSIDAEGNYFGSSRGPTIASNPGGDGASVSLKVDYSPWLAIDDNAVVSGPGFDAAVSTIYAVPTELRFTTQPPASTSENTQFTVVVTATDANGVLGINFNGSVALTLDSGIYAGALTGTTTIAAIDGVATFSGLAITSAGVYTIDAADSGFAIDLADATSDSITIDFPTPVLGEILPDRIVVGHPGFTMTLTGTGFYPTSVVYWDADGAGPDPAVALTTTYVSATELTANVPGSLLTTIDTNIDVTVTNIAPAGGTSNVENFQVLAAPTVVQVDDDWAGYALGTAVMVGPDTYYIGYDAWSTIQAGVDAVAASGTVGVLAGNYSESVVVGKAVTIDGAGKSATDTVVIATGAIGINITASGVTLTDLRVTGATHGIQVGGVSNTTLDGIAAVGNSSSGVNVVGSQANPTLNLLITGSDLSDNTNGTNNGLGFRMGTSAALNNLDIIGGTISGNNQGIFVAASTSAGYLTDVLIDGTAFSNNTFKGAYIEKLSNATITNVTFTNNGTDAANNFNAGLDLNLKYGNYSNITLSNATFTGNGTGADAASDVGNSITIKARNDVAGSPRYDLNPATLTGLTLSNVDITADSGPGSVVLLALGNGINLDGVGGVALSNVDLAGAGSVGLQVYGIDPGETLALADTSFDAGLAGYIVNSATGTTINGTTASYGGVNGGVGLSDTNAFAISDKIVDNIDVSTFGKVVLRNGFVYVTPNSFLVAGGTSAPSIQRGINAADAGQTVRVQSGAYSGVVVVNKQLTLSGANAGVAAGVSPGTRGAESILTGAFEVQASGITIDGFRVNNGAVTSGGENTALWVNNSNLTFANNILVGPNVSGTRGIITAYGTSNLTYTNNEITLFQRGMWNQGNTTVLISGNNIHSNWGAMSNDDVYGASITGNRIANNGGGIGFFNSVTNGTPDLVLSGNDLSGNGGGTIRHFGGDPINASGNWWGTTVEADILNKIWGGSGSAVGDASKVDFGPYLGVGTDDSTAPGFQPNYSVVYATAQGLQFGSTGRIQEAVDLATGSTPTVLVNVDTVLTGNYTKPVLANKNGLVIMGVNGTPSIAPTGVANAIEVSANNVRLENLAVNGIGLTPGGSGIVNTAAISGLTIQTVGVTNGTGAGITIDAQYGTVSGVAMSGVNASSNSGGGVHLLGGATNSITGVAITGSTFSSNRFHAVQIYGKVASPSITGSTFTWGSISSSPSTQGVIITGTDVAGTNSPTGVVLSNNTFNGYNNVTPAYAITLTDPANSFKSFANATALNLTMDGFAYASNPTYVSNRVYDKLDEPVLGLVTLSAISSQIIDNNQPGFTTSGTWTTSILGGFAGTSLVANPGPAATATWSFNVTPGKTYRVMATYPSHPNSNPNALFVVKDGGVGRIGARLNQQLPPSSLTVEGATWQYIGDLTASSANLAVELSNLDTTGITRADAIRIVEILTPPPGATIIDNNQPGFSTTGTWGTSIIGGVNGSNSFAGPASGASTATWTFNVTPGKTYTVMFTYPAHPTNTTNVPVNVLDGPGTVASLIVNQQVAPADVTASGAAWKILTTLSSSNSTLSVRITHPASSSTNTRADAVRIVEVLPLQVDESVALPAGLEVASIDTATLQFHAKAAINTWARAGLDRATLRLMRQVQFVVSDLPGRLLGVGTPGLVQIDPTAGGFGWSLLATPRLGSRMGLSTAMAAPSIDLVSVIAHELGHTVGLVDLDPVANAGTLMAATITPGARRLPTAADVAAIPMATPFPAPIAAVDPVSQAVDGLYDNTIFGALARQLRVRERASAFGLALQAGPASNLPNSSVASGFFQKNRRFGR